MTKESLDLATAIVTSLGGGSVVVFALSSWLGKVWAGRILDGERQRFSKELEEVRATLLQARDRLNADLTKTVQVHRAQFEVEFKALRVVWDRLVVLRSAIGILYQEVAIVSADEVPEVRRRRQVQSYCDAVRRFFWSVHKYSPFYPKDIYDQFLACLDIAQREESNARTFNESFRRESMTEGRTNRDQLFPAVEKASDMIRRRMEALSVR